MAYYWQAETLAFGIVFVHNGSVICQILLILFTFPQISYIDGL